ncbi:MAG: hypothetical protein CVV64_16000 [Candidatus Wallbacteria bacterium HGW-Wallbacteria-1]|jgi:hypothetical protein|uniref:Uncharacterized protein n=1 Tax=Candidatus Wallbacteria bacterium HGW-Wallbacteria-1 TaxID=2013854 RepID=A0A2N1PL51_9BACT|nr:MAG: hypothetical protein CVV64_16000 [Candidatus Wallbacteria bacterium HGW-Wallbacteria-1]
MLFQNPDIPSTALPTALPTVLLMTNQPQKSLNIGHLRLFPLFNQFCYIINSDTSSNAITNLSGGSFHVKDRLLLQSLFTDDICSSSEYFNWSNFRKTNE